MIAWFWHSNVKKYVHILQKLHEYWLLRSMERFDSNRKHTLLLKMLPLMDPLLNVRATAQVPTGKLLYLTGMLG